MASRILTNRGLEIEQTLSTGYLALVTRGIGLVRDTGIQNISGVKYFYDTITFYSGINVTGDFSILGGVVNNFYPKTDNLYDLGTASLEWRNLFLDGTAKVDSLIVDENAVIATGLSVGGNGVVSGNFNISGDFIPTNVAANFLPKTDSLYDLGSASQEFKDLFLDGTARVDSLVVDENAIISTGLSVGGNVVVSGDFLPTNISVSLLPKTDNLYDLGSPSQEFKDAYFDGTVKTDSLVVDESAVVLANLSVGQNFVSTGTSTASSVISSGSGSFGRLFITGSGIPLTPTSAGTFGQIVIGSGFLYACTGANQWGRTALASW